MLLKRRVRSRAAVLTMAALAGVPALACNKRPSPPPVPAAAAPAPGAPAAAPAPRTYGQALAPGGETLALAAVLEGGDRFANRALTVEGLVRRACTKKGCWMELAGSADKGTPGCRVTFKDYGFFVPTDAAGARARVQGVVEISKVEAPVVRHLEEEGAVFAKKESDGSAREVRIVATGVELWREAAQARP
jgi:hypothetical protein